MKQFAVIVSNTGQLVWVGKASSGSDACYQAAKEGNENVGMFSSFPSRESDDFEMTHLVLTAYDVSSLGDRANLAFLSENDSEMTEAMITGTFAALYLE
jgi:hypothetical protein